MNEEYILDLVKSICDSKTSTPAFATLAEIRSKVADKATEKLRKLCKDGKLEYHRLLNDTGFNINKTE